MTIIPEGFGQATYVFGGPALPEGGVVTIGYVWAADESPDIQALNMASLFTANILPRLNVNVTLERVDVKNGPNDTGPVGTFNVGEDGGISGPSSPPNTTWLAKKRTAMGGHRGSGRWYLPGLTDGDVGDNGIIDAGDVTLMQDAHDDYIANVDGLDYLLFLLHEDEYTLSIVDNKVVRTRVPDTAPVPTQITGFTVDNRIATQRRRNR